MHLVFGTRQIPVATEYFMTMKSVSSIGDSDALLRAKSRLKIAQYHSRSASRNLMFVNHAV